MKSFFIYINDQQQGPFTVYELKEMCISEGTPVWKEGFTTWKKAGEIDELHVCWESIPPPYNPAGNFTKPYIPEQKNISSAERVGRKFGKLLVWSGLIIITAIVAGFIYNNTSRSTGSILSYPLSDPEKDYPSNYLRADGNYKKNFWGDKITIKGFVTNTATHTNYKDVNIRVDFYSKTKSIIQSQVYVLYEYFPYGMTKNFELKLSIPSNMESCGWEATSATAY